VTVAVVADGGVSLPPQLDLPGVSVVAMQLRDAAVAPGSEAPTTAAPSPGDYLASIERVDDGDGVLVVTVAERFSASFAAARLACAEASPSRRVLVIDSGTATAGEGLVVLAAARAAATGAPLEAVAAAASAARNRVRLVAQIASLERLARGGRLPAAAAAGARLTGLRPLFELAGGEIHPLRPAFGAAGGEARIIAALRRSVQSGSLHVAALHAGEGLAAQRLLDAARRVAEPAESFLTELSPLMRAHTGEGVSGLAWWWET
jgi:DegV family protein with EDD domain